MGDVPKGMLEVMACWDCPCHFMEWLRPKFSPDATFSEFQKARAEMDKLPRRHICDRGVHGFKPFGIPDEFISGKRCMYICPIRQSYYRDVLRGGPSYMNLSEGELEGMRSQLDEATRQKLQEYIDAEPNVPENPETVYSTVVIHKVGI